MISFKRGVVVVTPAQRVQSLLQSCSSIKGTNVLVRSFPCCVEEAFLLTA